ARGNVFREEDLKEGVAVIQRLLVANGFNEAKVTPAVTPDSAGQQMDVTITVAYGKRARYQTPVVHGDAGLPVNMIGRVTGWQVRFIKRWQQVNQARTRRGVAGILKKYESQDRLKAQVRVEKMDYDPAKRRVTPELNLERGPQVKVIATEASVS